MSIKRLEKELKKQQKIAEKEEKEAILKRKIKELKYRKYIKAGERVRGGIKRLGSGTQKILGKMKEMENKEKKQNKKKFPIKEDYLARLNKALS